MRLAYIISVHKGFEQICLLIDQITDDSIDVYIHVDKNSEKLYCQLQSFYCQRNNVILIEDRVHVNWSGLSQVEATLNLLKAVRDSNEVYDYISFISGQCYPLKSNQYIKEYLEQNTGKEFIEYSRLSERDLFRIRCYNFFREYKYIRTLWMRILDNVLRRLQKPFIRRKNLEGLHLYHGSSWWTITYECAIFILEYLRENPKYFTDFKYTLCPDEHFFQILIMNSEYSNKVVNDNLRYINWKGRANSPEIIKSDDFSQLKASQKLYARKFDINIDENILNRIKDTLI